MKVEQIKLANDSGSVEKKKKQKPKNKQIKKTEELGVNPRFLA